MNQLESIEVYLSPDGESAIVIDGERRLRAARYVNEHFDEWSKEHPDGHRFDLVRCKYGPKDMSEEERILRQIEHNEYHEPLKPIEKAQAYKDLVDIGWTQQKIAKAVNKSPAHVGSYLSMLSAPKELQDAVGDGRMSPTAASKVSKAKPEKRAQAVEKLKGGEKVKISDVVDSGPLGIGDLKKCIKKAEKRIFQARGGSNNEWNKWIGVKYGLEIAAGMHDKNF